MKHLQFFPDSYKWNFAECMKRGCGETITAINKMLYEASLEILDGQSGNVFALLQVQTLQAARKLHQTLQTEVGDSWGNFRP
jgi:hypothetical protein